MSETLEQRIRRVAKESVSLGTIQAYAEDAVQLLDERDGRIKELELALEKQHAATDELWAKLKSLHSFTGVQLLLQSILDDAYPPNTIVCSDRADADVGAQLTAAARKILELKAQLFTVEHELLVEGMARDEIERKAIEQSEYIQTRGLTQFEMGRLKAERDAFSLQVEALRQVAKMAHVLIREQLDRMDDDEAEMIADELHQAISDTNPEVS